MIFTVQLENLHFHARHGVFPQENRVGAEFRVDVSLDVEIADPSDSSPSAYVSYADVFDIVKERMQKPTPLLETVAYEIAVAVRHRWECVKGGSVKISKAAPPISGIIGSASVSLRLEEISD